MQQPSTCRSIQPFTSRHPALSCGNGTVFRSSFIRFLSFLPLLSSAFCSGSCRLFFSSFSLQPRFFQVGSVLAASLAATAAVDGVDGTVGWNLLSGIQRSSCQLISKCSHSATDFFQPSQYPTSNRSAALTDIPTHTSCLDSLFTFLLYPFYPFLFIRSYQLILNSDHSSARHLLSSCSPPLQPISGTRSTSSSIIGLTHHLLSYLLQFSPFFFICSGTVHRSCVQLIIHRSSAASYRP